MNQMPNGVDMENSTPPGRDVLFLKGCHVCLGFQKEREREREIEIFSAAEIDATYLLIYGVFIASGRDWKLLPAKLVASRKIQMLGSFLVERMVLLPRRQTYLRI